MAKRPVIAYVESSSQGMTESNHYREALSFFLREDCGCEVLLYGGDWDLEEDVERLKQHARLKHLILVIVAQEEYSDQHDRVITLVRSQISKEVPINVLPRGWPTDGKRFKARTEDASVYDYGHHDKGLADLVSSQKASWKAPVDWLGAETKEDQTILMSQLENAYRTHYLGDDEGMLGTPDVNSQIVFEALRLRLLPSQFLKAEFDDTLVRKPRNFVRAEDTVYQKELAKLRGMTDEERQELDDALSRARGHEPHPGGGVIVTRASCGENVSGYAIDPDTLQTHVTDRFGLHHMATEFLGYRIGAIQEIRNHSHVNKFNYRGDIIGGLIFSKIEGFETPLLLLFVDEFHGTEPEHLRKVGRFLLAEQKYIPIDHDMKVIEG